MIDLGRPPEEEENIILNICPITDATLHAVVLEAQVSTADKPTGLLNQYHLERVIPSGENPERRSKP